MSDADQTEAAGQKPRRYKHVHQFKDRHGNARLYFRPPGMHAMPLRGPIGSPAFLEDYHAALPALLDAEKNAKGRSFRLSIAAERRKKNVELAIWRGEEPPACGVYFLMLEGVLVYIGSSTSIKTRVLQHRQNGRPFDRAYALGAPEGEHKKLELMFIRKMTPKQNRAGLTLSLAAILANRTQVSDD